MWWRLRTTLPDRPGSLAMLADHCGRAGVNILAMQIFPGVDGVTDELVLRTPEGWGPAEVRHLVEGAGGRSVVVAPCTEEALADQPTRYVQAARAILTRPASFPEVVARLFDAEADPTDPGGPPQDVMEMTVADVQVQVRRAAPFTATEHARGAAMADLVSDVLQRSRSQEAMAGAGGSRRIGGGSTPEHVVDGSSVSAVHEGLVVGLATVHPPLPGDSTVRPVVLRVDPAWRRRGIGSRLLVDAARLAQAQGAEEIVLRTRSDNQAVLPMVLAAGLRARIRMAADVLTVRVAVRALRPLDA
ncbi:GNAT family N-acetyltransferase [Nocardioides sp. SYSU DS0663]|uniref:GNAT family N-acetyltransferase n=1 Tax=Nocardioides sp. SYSU DS0663 TaxID=3416445 RepID=UPI003F4B3573